MCKTIYLPKPHGVWMAPNAWNRLPIEGCDKLLKCFGNTCWFCDTRPPTTNVYQPHWLPACDECAAKVAAGRLPAPQCCTCLRTCPAAAPRARAWHSPWRCMPCHLRGFEEAVARAMVESAGEDDGVWEQACTEAHARVSARFAGVGGEDKWWAADVQPDEVWPLVEKARWRGLPDLVLKGGDGEVLVSITAEERVRNLVGRRWKKVAVCSVCHAKKECQFVKGMCGRCYQRSRMVVRKCMKCKIKRKSWFTKDGMCDACRSQSRKVTRTCTLCGARKTNVFTAGVCKACQFHKSKTVRVCIMCERERHSRFVKGMCASCYATSRKETRTCPACNVHQYCEFRKNMCPKCYRQSLKTHATS